MEAVAVTDRELDQLIAARVKGVTVTAKDVRARANRPAHLDRASSVLTGQASRPLFVPPIPRPGLPVYLDVGGFGDSLNAALMNNVAGYAVQLRQSGEALFTQAWGNAKGPQEQGGAEAWTTDVQQHVASVSKLITAMAMTRLLGDKQISPDTQIIDYLPDYWPKGPNIEYIVFRNLLNHTSGLSGPASAGGSFDIMKNAIAAGISLDANNASGHLGGYCYKNLNYCLCRILLAVINGTITKSTEFPFGLSDLLWDLVTVQSYAQYCQTNVFAPAGVTGATLDHLGGAALAYTGPGDTAQGWNSGNMEQICGGDGWHLSVDQLLDVMGQFRRGGGIVSTAAAAAMLVNMFGVDPFVDSCPQTIVAQVGDSVPTGVVYCKPGDWEDTAGRSEHTVALFFPQDIEVALLVNSPDPRTSQIYRDVVMGAYLSNLTTQLSVHL